MPNAQSNSPSRSALAQYSEHQLLVMILTELRVQTQLQADEYDADLDLDDLRVQVMNANDIVTGDAG